MLRLCLCKVQPSEKAALRWMPFRLAFSSYKMPFRFHAKTEKISRKDIAQRSATKDDDRVGVGAYRRKQRGGGKVV